MQYREFGNTGIKISTLGFGCMRLPHHNDENGDWVINQELVNEMLQTAYKNGVNYFDTAPTYCNSMSEKAVGIALKDIRDKVYISTKVGIDDSFKDGSVLRERLMQSLENLQTDYIDFYHFWGINKGTVDYVMRPNGLLDEMVKLKEEGLIRHVSFSFHDSCENLIYIIDNCPELESLLCQYNLLDRQLEKGVKHAREKGLGVIAMGPVGGGRLAAPGGLYEKLTGKKSDATYELALRFVLGNKDFCCALSGMENMEMLKNNIAIASDPIPMTYEEWDKAGRVAEQLKKFSDLYCTGCNYCQPCPRGIVIPRIFEAFTLSNVYGLDQAAKGNYNWYVNGEKKPTAEECIECGQCEKKCPQKIKIISELKRVTKHLNSL